MTFDLTSANGFVLRHGRLLDRRRFELLFGEGDRGAASELVWRALIAYQNPDGGFGNAIEPDLRCAASQTVGAEVALRTFSELAAVDADAVAALCDWCGANAYPSGGLPFALPTVVSGPRAPWWQPTHEPSVNPTAAIVGLLTKLGFDHDWIGRATEWCWKDLATNVGSYEPHGALCALTFLEAHPSDARTAGIADELRERVVAELVELDPDADGYVFPPLQFARHPASRSRAWFDDVTIERHLAALEAGQLADGGWQVSWDPPSSSAASEWRSVVTIEALKTLRNYSRLR